MTKISLLPNDSAPVGTDILVGDQTSSNTTENFKLSDILTYIKNNIGAIAYSPYKCDCYLSNSAVGLTSGVWTKASINIKNFDTGNNFDPTTNYRFTAPQNGFYLINGQAAITQAGASTGAMCGAIFKNGAALITGTSLAPSGDSRTINRPTMGRLVQLSAGDYIEVYGYENETGRNFDYGNDKTFLTVALYSAT